MTAVVDDEPVVDRPPPARPPGKRLTALLAVSGVVAVLVGVVSARPDPATTPNATTPRDRSAQLRAPLPKFLQATGLYRTEIGPTGLFPGNWLDDSGELRPVDGRLGRYVAMTAVTVREPRRLTVGADTQTVGPTPRTYLFRRARSGGDAVDVSGELPLRRVSAADPRKVSVFLGPALSADQPWFLLPLKGYYARETGLIGAEISTFQWMTPRTRMGIHVDDPRLGQPWVLRVVLRSPIRRKVVIRLAGGATGPVATAVLEPQRDVTVVVRGIQLSGERGVIVINFGGPTSLPGDPRPLAAQLRSATITP